MVYALIFVWRIEVDGVCWPYVQTWVEYKFPAKLSDATKVHMCDMLTY